MTFSARLALCLNQYRQAESQQAQASPTPVSRTWVIHGSSHGSIVKRNLRRVVPLLNISIYFPRRQG
jgi:hypothetical protein